MSEENVEMVRAAIEAFNRGAWDAVLKDAAPCFEYDHSRAINADIRGVYGRDQLRRFWTELADRWESIRAEPHEFIEAGNHVVMPVTVHGVGRDGIEVEARVSLTFTIRDGAIERACMYQERREALEAAGLEE